MSYHADSGVYIKTIGHRLAHTMTTIAFDNSYTQLPDRFYSRLNPTPVEAPGPIRVNGELAKLLGIDPLWLASAEGTQVIAGNALAQGSEPMAAVYAGHQFGSYNPQLGDGRALLLGEVIGTDGQRYDIQLKGSGPTPYSRGGDGRSPLGPVLREYVVSEAMHALGVPTTRALAAVTTGERVAREQFLPGAVLARVAHSHIRIGTVQFFAARDDKEALRALVDYTLSRHYRQAQNAENPAKALLENAIAAQAALVTKWQLLGFIHGVMNTDNMLLSGQTIDYGPCAFMDDFQVDKVFSSIDQNGRYAYQNQPAIAHWNLANLAQSLLPLFHEDQEQAVAIAQETVDTFPAQYTAAHRQGLANKLGLGTFSEGDDDLVAELFRLMTDTRADFTLCFRRLADHVTDAQGVKALYEFPETFDLWLARWRSRTEQTPLPPQERQATMYAANPAIIPRNHLVEAAIRAAEDHNDFAPFNALVEATSEPFIYSSDLAYYATPPRPEEAVSRTFCGT